MKKLVVCLAVICAAFLMSCAGDDGSTREGETEQDTGGTGPINVGDEGPKGEDTPPVVLAGDVGIFNLIPKTGPTTGGTVAAILGAGFRDGARVYFGDNEAQVVKFVDSGHLAVVAPVGNAGPVDVKVENNDGGAGTFANGFVYYDLTGEEDKPPTLVKAVPNSGPASGGTALLLQGDGFKTGAYIFMDWKIVSSGQVSSNQWASLITPSLAPGTIDIAITNPDGQSDVLEKAFAAYDASREVTPGPQIAKVYPSAGSVKGGLEVTITGSNFHESSYLILGGEPVETWNVVSPTEGIFMTPAHAPGLFDVAITNPDGQSAIRKKGFHFFVDPPVVYFVDPDSGPLAGGGQVTLHGANFAQGMTIHFGEKPCDGVSIGAADGAGTKADTATCTVPPADEAGPVTVRVQNPDGLLGLLPKGYTYEDLPTPIIAGIVPLSGPVEGGYVAVVTGTGFLTDSAVWLGDAQPDVVARGETSISIMVPAGAAGAVDVTVATPGFDDTSLAGGFTYTEPGPPKLLDVTPAEGPVDGGIVVAVSGENLRPESVVWFGDNVATEAIFGGSDAIAATLPAGLAGSVNVTIKTPGYDDTTLVKAFEYTEPGPPTLFAVEPEEGPSEGGITIAVVGQDLRPDSVVWFGDAEATEAFYSGPDGIAVTLPAHAAGTVDVILKTPGHPDSTLKKSFSFIEPGEPEITGVAPSNGPVEGGFVVAIIGENLQPTSQVFFGSNLAETAYFGGSKGIGVILPAGDGGGAVDVIVTTEGYPDSILPGGFTYTEDGPPKITGVTPSEGPTEGGILVAVTGLNLLPTSTVWFGGTPANETIYGGPSGLGVTLPASAAGTMDVTIKTPGFPDSVLEKAFTFIGAGEPSITAVAPSSGPTEGGIVVAVVGENLLPTSQVVFGSVAATTVYSSGKGGISVLLPAGEAGAVDVRIVTPGYPDSVLEKGFTYAEPGPPLITGVVPDTGPADGGIVVLVDGTDFRPDSTVWFGDEEAGTLYVTGPNGIAVLLPAHAIGIVDVLVKTPGHPDAVLPAGFEFEAPDIPTSEIISLAQIQPSTGPTTGGGWALLKGFNLPVDAKVSFGDAEVTEMVAVNEQTLSVKVPASLSGAGAVDVSVEDPATGLKAVMPAAYTYYLPEDAEDPAPNLSWIKPGIGPALGGTLAWLSGAAFLDGALVFVDGRPGTKVTVASGTTTTFATPFGKPGPANVMLVNPDGQWAQLDNAFVYTSDSSPSVTLTSAIPEQGSVAGGTVVTVTGSGIKPGFVAFMDGVPVQSKLKSPSSFTLTTPAHSPGLVDIAITAPDGWTATLGGAFNFILQAPFIAAVVPDFGPPAGGTEIVISGQGFHPDATVSIGGVAATVVEADDSLIIATTPAGDLGPASITVTNPDFLASTLEGGFLYTDVIPGDAIQVFSIAPPIAPITGGTTSTITGQGFGPGATVIIGTSVSENVQVLSSTTLLAEIPAGALGAHDVSVVVPDIGTGVLPTGFFYYDPNGETEFPKISGIEPTVGPVAGGTIARLDVVPALTDATVYVDGLMAEVLGGNGVDHLVVKMPAHDVGTVAVSVMHTDGKADTLVGAFTYYEPSPTVAPPALNSIDPTDGTVAGGQPVTLSGAKFGAGAIAFLGYRKISVTNADDSSVAGTSPAHPAALVDAVVTRQDGFSAVLKGAFGYTIPAPVPEMVFPTKGHVDGGLTVVVAGSGFQKGAEVFLGTMEATNVVVPADNVLTFTTPPVATPQTVSIMIVNPDGQTGQLDAAFEYTDEDFDAPPPEVLTLVPDQGPFQGGTVLAIYGSGFQKGATILFNSKPAAVHLIDGDLATVTTPSGFVGPVDVTILNPDGQSGGKPLAFDYIVTTLKKPDLLGITPKSGPEAGGTNVILTGKNLTGGGVGFVGYRPLSSWTVLNTSIATGTTQPGGQGDADVVTTNGDGQSSILVDGYNYVGAPFIDSFNPSVGAVAGGKVVTIAGKNFSALSKVEIGGKLAQNVQVLSEFVIKLQTPSGDPGPAQVKVTNPDGQFHIAEDPYLYVLPPLVSAIFPTQGSAEGGTPIVIMGEAFLDGAQLTFNDVPATQVVVVDEFTITARTPAGAIDELADVRVINIDGQEAILYKAFTWVDPATIGPAPVATELRPATGPSTGGTWGLIIGENLQPGGWAIFGTVPVMDQEVYTGVKARYVSAQSTFLGEVDVILLNPDGGWGLLPAGFTYTDPATLDDPPEVTSVLPGFGPTKGGGKVTLSGSELNANTVVFFGTAAGIEVTEDAENAAIIVTTPAQDMGTVDIVVTDEEGQTVHLADAFDFIPPPVIYSIDPDKGPSAGGTFVAITGDFFVKGEAPNVSKVLVCEEFASDLNCTQVPVEQIVVKDSTLIHFTTPEQLPGLSDVVVVNPDGQVAVLELAFFFTPPPKVTQVTPPTGTTLGGDSVTISGTGFQGGLQVTFSGVKCTDLVVQDSATITCKTPAGAPGPAAVVVTNPDLSTMTLGGGFLYIKPPKIINVFPTLGPETGGTVVTIQGDGFVPLAIGSKVFFGNKEVPAADMVVESENLITAKTPPGAGPVAVKVVNPDGQLDVLGGGFIYIPVIPAPKVNNVQPTFGPTGGGYLLQVVGENFLGGAQVSLGNDAVGYVNGFDAKVKNAGTLIVVTAPAHPAGKVNVKVTNSDGQNGVLEQGFEYIGPLGLPGLAFSGLAPDRGPPEGGYDVVVYGQGFKTGVTVFWGNHETEEWVESSKVVRLGPTLLKVTMPNYGKNGKADIRISNPAFGGLSDEVVGNDVFTFGQSVVLDPKGHRLPIDTMNDDRHTIIFDANGDGLNDIMVLHFGDYSELYINTKDEDGVAGKFFDSTKTNMPKTGTYTNPMFPNAVDLDSDGDLDVLVSYGWGTANNVGVYKNAGDGTFTFHNAGNHGLNPKGMEVGDLNCDGHPDLLITSDAKNVVMINNGLSAFKVRDVLPNHTEPSRGAAIGDVDNDGDNDILIGNDNAAQNRLYYNNCNNIDTPPVCTTTIPNSIYKIFGGHQYFFTKWSTSWKNAETECNERGYHLATIETAEEQEFIRTEMYSTSWFGYTDEVTDTVWVWPFGESTYTNWCGNEPNGAADQGCAGMHKNSSGCWFDDKCTTGRYFICEADSVLTCPAEWGFTDANYGTGKNFPVSGFSTKDVELADLDGDGWLDAVLVNWGQSTRIYFNDGGNFNNDNGLHFPQEETLAKDAEIFIIDVDLDNDMDILVRKYQESTNRYWPHIYLNAHAQSGSAVFTDATPVNMPAWRGEDSLYMAVGDLNQDNLADVLVINKDHQDWLMLNHGWAENKPMIEASRVPIGAFANNTMFGVPEDVADAYVADVGDIDGDGDIDVVIGYVDKTLTPAVWINDSEGNFFEESGSRMPADLNCDTRGLELVDVNGDGDLDVLMACQAGKRQLVNDGTGFFTHISSGNIPSWTSGDYSGLATGDIDGDGDLDWFLTSNGYTAWVTFLNGGDVYGQDGAFFVLRNDMMDTAKTSTCGNCISEKGLAVGDFNADGALDLYVGTPGQQNQLWHNNHDNKAGFFHNVTFTHLPAVNDNTNVVLSTDVDFDGDVDFFVVNNGNNRLHIGELDFKYADATASNLPLGIGKNSTWGAVVDLDMDGFPDFVTSSWGQQNQLILNKGGATFEDFTTSMPKDIDPSRCVRLADFDGDGVDDLFFANRQVNRIYLNKTPPPPAGP